MKAISLWQPWASLWLSPRKIHETRHWPIHHRGWLLVHAAKRFERDIDPGDPLREILDDEFGGHWAMDLPTGALLGVVNVVACKRTEDVLPLVPDAAERDDFECGDYHPGRFAWQRSDYRVFERPIPYRGMQGLFDVPNDVLPEPYRSGRVREGDESAPELGSRIVTP